MDGVVLGVAQTVVRKSTLPNLAPKPQFHTGTTRVSALNELNSSLQRDSGWCKDEMEMFRHDSEIVQQIAPLGSIVLKDVEEEPGHALRSKQGPPTPRDGGDEIRSFSEIGIGESFWLCQVLPQRLKPSV